ncbi:TCR/Tet family MFS transporter [Brevundimonas sp. NIBR11]|uniref:TCR/Tet family MFS transporter n=1 Tax=Brevundimonas sp. NIBR11 TaxID=3015999 RepID=UPI0022F103B8|nr:TCR/Tet family MFS transporter [Brevundimonas sp. NIBR11]WGM30852.1 Tetracycline resistance protein, class C [Brevundimonas sp. NIBR11]
MSILHPKARKAAIAFIFVTAVLDILSMGVIMPVLPSLIEEFAGSDASAGIWNGAFVAMWAAMQFLASPVTGSLSDRYGRRPVILISCAGLALDWMLMALAPNLWWLAVGRILGGLTSSSFTAIYAYMADITAPENRARAYGLIGAAFSGGFVLGPVIGGFLGEIGPRAPFWFAAALSGVAFLYGLFILPESLPAEKRMPFSWKRANPLGAMELLRRHAELTGLAVVNFLLYFSHHVFSAIFVLYAMHRYGWGPREVGLLLAGVGVVDMAMQGAVVGPVIKALGDRRTMLVGFLGGTIGMAMMGWAPNGLWFTLAMLPNALWGLAMPTMQALMTRRVGDDEQGQLQGANNSVASIAGIASPLFFGWVYAISVGPEPWVPHPGMAFFMAAAVLAAAGLLGWRVGVKAERAEAAASTP